MLEFLRLKWLRVAVAMVAALAGVTFATFDASPARADTLATGASPGLCATVSNNALQLNPCQGGDAQDWFKNAYGVQNGYHGLCLDSASAAAGAQLVVVGCQNKPSQRWGYDTTTRALRNEAGWCADVLNGRAITGQPLIIWACNRQSNQVWMFNRVATSVVSAPAGAACNDAWITRAVQEAVGRLPRGSGVSGECSPQYFSLNGNWTSYRDLLNKVVVKLTNKGAAYVFIAPSLAVLQGHVGWAYVNNDGSYSYGATDAPVNLFKGQFGVAIFPGVDSNQPWRGRVNTEKEMFDAFRGHYGDSVAYNEMKFTYVLARNEALANQRATEIRNVGYTLIGNNCLDHTYTVLAAYGVNEGDVMQPRLTRPAPNSWFRAFGGMTLNGQTSRSINSPGEAF